MRLERSFKLYNLSYTHIDSGANFNQVKSAILSDKPIYASLSTSDSKTKHAVVIAGFESGYGNYYYRLMDPNKRSLALVQLSSSSATSFSYAPGSNTYTKRYCHIY